MTDDSERDWGGPPPPRPRRRNVVFLRLYDFPPYRDWLAWWTLAVAVLTFAALATPTATSPPSPLPMWLNVPLGTVVLTSLFAIVPAALRLRVRRWMWGRRARAAHQDDLADRSTDPTTGPRRADRREGAPPTQSPDPRDVVPAAPPKPGISYPLTEDDARRVPPPRPSGPNDPAAAPLPRREPVIRPAAVVPITLSGDRIASSPGLREARNLQYPIARAVRALQLATTPKDQYEAVLESADAVSIALGASAAAWLRSHGQGAQELGDLLKAYERGVTQGTWHEVLLAGARVAAADSSGPPGLASAARSRRKGTLLAHLGTLLQERNKWAHGAGPRSPHEAGIRVATVLPVLESALASCSFLAAAPWVLTQSTSFRARTRDFEVVAFSAMADHPEFERRRFTSTVPLADDRFYMLLDGAEPVDLTPFVVLRHCEVCGRREVFHSDRLADSGGVVLKSFGSGHPQTDRVLADELRAIAEPPGPLDSTG